MLFIIFKSTFFHDETVDGINNVVDIRLNLMVLHSFHRFGDCDH
jgi:hypothetical protein